MPDERHLLWRLRHEMRSRTPGAQSYEFVPKVTLTPAVTGGRQRCIDAVAHVVDDRGRLILGGDIWAFEVKRTTDDFRREMRDPTKADPFLFRSHYFYLVEGERGAIPLNEVPESMGLLTFAQGRFYVEKEAPRRPPDLGADTLTYAVAATGGLPVRIGEQVSVA